MNWLRKMFARHDELPIELPVPYSGPSPELLAAQQRHRVLLSRADRAIQQAMNHADEAFGAPPGNHPHRRSTDR